MPDVTIRPLTLDEVVRDFMPLVSYSFTATPPMFTEEQRETRRQYYEERTVIGVYEEETLMAGAGIIPMTQNVRGTIYPMGGIAPVTTRPEARRKGYARDVMQAAFQHMHNAGYSVTGLYPFRESFYERLGYVTFPQVRIAEFAATALAPLLRMTIPGRVTMQPMTEGFDTFRAYTLERQRETHGMAYHPPSVARNRPNRNEEWVAVARHGDQILGVMLYKITDFGGTFEVSQMHYSTGQGKYLLLQWIARHIDQTKKVQIELPAAANAETWLSDVDIKFHSTTWVTAMGRILDVQKIGGMAVGDGAFVAKIQDDLCPWNNGIFAFDAREGRLLVRELRSLPDCTLTIQGLSALVFGTHDPSDFVWRGWAQHLGETTVRQMAVMFPRALPHMHEAY
ncbi:GNAT family N-acetyltransferase [bacterium]|nr:GNAT family N-acetyltransferase [bacterium]